MSADGVDDAAGPMMSIEEYAARFDEEPGYLDFARVGPIGAAVVEEEASLIRLLAGARFGSLDPLFPPVQDLRVRAAIAELTGFRSDQIAFQPNTSQGLMHTMFGISGGVALSAADFPSLTFAVTRAAQALGALEPVWMDTQPGRTTPGGIRDQNLAKSVVAVAVSLVDFRTGYLVDLEGIRQVIGDRLLIVDATQGFGVVDAPYSLADVVVAGGQKWPRAGWGTGFMALSDRALDHLKPFWSGFSGIDVEGTPYDEVAEPMRGAGKFAVSYADPVAQARLAASLEEIASVGVAKLGVAVAGKVGRIIELADEFGIPVVSPRAEAERAGIAVVEPAADQLTVLAAALHNSGISATVRSGQARLSAHASTDEETFAMLRSAFLAFATAVSR